MQKLKYGNGSISTRSRKRKDGTERRYYQGRIYIDGEQKTVYGNTQAECLAKLKALREERDRERAQRLLNIEGQPRDGQNDSKQQFRTFGEWLDEWTEQCKVGTQKETYTPEFRRQVETVRAALGHLALRKIASLELQRYFTSLPRSNTTAKKYDIVNGSLQTAEDFGIIKRNPCRAVKKPTYTKQKRRAFQLAEQCAILSALPERYAAVFFFLCGAGLRIGEFLALTAADVNFAEHYIKVGASKDLKTGVIVVPKTAAGVRKVYFAAELFERFNVQTLGTYTYNAIKKAFTKVYKKLDIEGVSVTHSCRHTYSSLLYAVGVADKIIQLQCGHADIKTTMNTYTDILMTGASPVLDYIRQLKSTLKSTLLFA
ncbi:MAG: site-specific integrase [Clostridia bacterium]|nr:site-specific integrase [Clostridia bacterium]